MKLLVMQFRDELVKGRASNFGQNSEKSETETLAMIGQAVGEEIISHTRKVQTHRDREGRDECRTKSRAFSLTSRGLFTKN
jgi:hypothetical protein